MRGDLVSKDRIRELRAKAAHPRDFAEKVCDDKAAANLRSYAVDLEAEAARVESGTGPAVISESKADPEKPAG
jgi:hypothetical protein